jgi:Sec-independent protein translocase protein TatA
VRAIDKAHNVRDVSVDVKPPILITKFIKQYIVYILLAIILIGLAALIMHYVFGHHIIRHIKEFKKLLNEENENKNETKESMNSYTETPIKPDQNNHQNEIIIVKKDSNL